MPRQGIAWTGTGDWAGYGIIVGATGLLTLVLHSVARPGLPVAGLLYLYLLVVMLASVRWGLLHALFAIVISMIAADEWVMSPSSGFRMDAEQGIRLAIFVTIAVVQSIVQNRLRRIRATLQKRFSAEHEVAELLRDAVLPTLKEIAGYETALLYETAALDARVGGDFLDILDLGDGRVCLLVGDIAGHGIQVAIQTVKVSNLIRTFVFQGKGPAECLRCVNAALCSDPLAPVFATIFLGILDTTTHVLRYASAGHEPALLYTPSSHEVAQLHPAGLPVAISDNGIYDYEQGCQRIEPGMTLLMYTDGIVEARGSSGFYGLESLKASLHSVGSETANEAVHRLYSGACSFAGERLHDDVAMLWIQRAPESAAVVSPRSLDKTPIAIRRQSSLLPQCSPSLWA